MFVKIVTSAVFAGFAAGLTAAVLQLLFLQPVLLHAELYESGALVHFGATGPVSADPDLGGIDFARDALSVLFTLLTYTGYAFVLVALMVLAGERGVIVNARAGLIWGAAGFIAVQLAPSVSLPPLLPGAAAAEVVPRQIWWVSTIVATAIAMALIGFGKSWGAWAAAAALLLAPHLFGAPQPAQFYGPVPPELGSLFAARVLGVGMAAWVLLGLACGWFVSRDIAARPAKPA